MLKKELTLTDLVFYGIGVIIGAGIYVLIGPASGMAGNTVWLSFVIAAVVAAFTGLSYAELSSMYTRDAAEYTYVKRVVGKTAGFVTGWMIFFATLIASSVVALGFGKYFYAITGIDALLSAAVLIVFFTLVNYIGAKTSSRVNIILTALTIIGLMIIIAVGLRHFGSVDYFYSPGGMTGTVGAATLVFFAYLGFNQIVNVGEEVKDAKKNIPKAIIISITVTTAIYVLVALAAVSAVPWQSLSQSSTPLALVAASAFGNSTDLILSVIALFATASSALIFMLAASRMIFGMAELRAMPAPLARLDKRGTPYAAVIVTGLLALFFVLAAGMNDIALLVNFSAFAIFAAVNLSAFVLRFSEPGTKRHFRVPLSIGRAPVIPLLGFLVSVYMMLQFDMAVIWNGIIIAVLGYLFCKYAEAGKTRN
jgi:APA family basic amino acid/polyamine antiporter